MIPLLGQVVVSRIDLGCENGFGHGSRRSRSNKDSLAGAGGFEPPYDEIKIRCLTTWRRPNPPPASTWARRKARRTIVRAPARRNGRRAILRRGGRFPTGGIRLPRAASQARLGRPPSRSGPAAALMSRAAPRMHAPRSRPRRQSGGQPSAGSAEALVATTPVPAIMGGRSERVAATARARLAGGGRLRRLGPSRRDRRFANLLNSVSILYEAREHNVFGETESGYTALCGDKNESTAMTNTSTRTAFKAQREIAVCCRLDMVGVVS